MVKNSDIASIIDISLFKTKYPQSISLPQQHPILNIITIEFKAISVVLDVFNLYKIENTLNVRILNSKIKML